MEISRPEAVIRLGDAPTHAVPSLLFGQFLERFAAGSAPEGELGAQAAAAQGAPFALRSDVTENLRRLRPTLVRFPGGMAVETLYDRTSLIDRSPRRDQPVAMGSVPAAPVASMLDVIATEGPDSVTVHAINRSPDETISAVVEVGSRQSEDQTEWHRPTSLALDPQHAPFAGQHAFDRTAARLVEKDGTWTCDFPPASVHALVFKKALRL
jgi:hypothetical protein